MDDFNSNETKLDGTSVNSANTDTSNKTGSAADVKIENPSITIPSLGKGHKLWMALYAIAPMFFLPMIINMFFPSAGLILLTLIGAAVGIIFYLPFDKKTKGKKVLMLLVEIILIFGIYCVVLMATDDGTYHHPGWKVRTLENVSFLHPDEFYEVKNNDETPSSIAFFQAFRNGNEKQSAFALVLDMIENPDKPSLTLSAYVTTTLRSKKATDLKWFDPVTGENYFHSRIEYKVAGTKYVGFGFIYFQDTHYEMIMCLPVAEPYEDNFIDDLIQTIAIDKKNIVSTKTE